MAQVLEVPFDELKQLDSRLPVEELKRAMRHDPALGFALRTLAEKKVSSDEILKWAEGKAKKRSDEK